MREIPKSLIDDAKRTLGEGAIGIMSSILKHDGKDTSGKKFLCPVHNEKTASFSWHAQSNSFKCFGCGARLDVIGYYMQYDGMSFQDAVMELFRETGVGFSLPELSPEELEKKKAALCERQATYEKLTKQTEMFQRAIKETPYYDYIINRWGFCKETIDRYKLGYSASGYFGNRIVIPYLNAKGQTVYATGRDMSGKSSRKYLNLKKGEGIEGQPLYNARALSSYKNYVVVVEGEKDCITLLQAGYNAVAFGGSSTAQLEQIKLNRDIKTVYVIPDLDKAGQEKAEKVGVILGANRDVRIVELPLSEGDVHDYYMSDRANFKSNLNELLKKSELYVNEYRSFELNDTGNAERFVYLFGSNLRYRVDHKKWLRWNGHKWSHNDDLGVELLTKRVVKAIEEEGQRLHDYQLKASEEEEVKAGEDSIKVNTDTPAESPANEESKSEVDSDGKEDEDTAKAKKAEAILGKYLKHANKTASKKGRMDMLELARCEEGVPVMAGDLDKDKYLLNCKNGTIDLRTRVFKASNKKDLITKSTAVKYDPTAKAERWEQFVLEIMGHDAEMAEFLQRAIGYTLTGDTREECFFIPYGVGSNGKSKFKETIAKIMGTDYAANVQPETLTKKREGGSATSDVARLEGKRLITTSEGGHSVGLNEELVKQLTADSTITARYQYGNEFEFEPLFKIWFSTNHKPEIQGTDDGIWRRINLIPFEQRFVGQEEFEESRARNVHLKDLELESKLEEELSGILNWAIEGCRKWIEDGLQVPSKVARATNEYRLGEDVTQAFIDECILIDPDYRVPLKEVVKTYNNFCLENGEKILKQKHLKEKLVEKGFTVRRGTGNKLTVFGMRLAPATEVSGSKVRI